MIFTVVKLVSITKFSLFYSHSQVNLHTILPRVRSINYKPARGLGIHRTNHQSAHLYARADMHNSIMVGQLFRGLSVVPRMLFCKSVFHQKLELGWKGRHALTVSSRKKSLNFPGNIFLNESLSGHNSDCYNRMHLFKQALWAIPIKSNKLH